MTVKGNRLGFLTFGMVGNLPVGGLFGAGNGEIQNHGTVLGTGVDFQIGDLGFRSSMMAAAIDAGELMEAVNFDLDGIAGTGGQIGENNFTVFQRLALGVAMGIRADDGQLSVFDLRIHGNGELIIGAGDLQSINALQVVSPVEEQTADGKCTDEKQHQNQNQRVELLSGLLSRRALLRDFFCKVSTVLAIEDLDAAIGMLDALSVHDHGSAVIFFHNGKGSRYCGRSCIGGRQCDREVDGGVADGQIHSGHRNQSVCHAQHGTCFFGDRLLSILLRGCIAGCGIVINCRRRFDRGLFSGLLNDGLFSRRFGLFRGFFDGGDAGRMRIQRGVINRVALHIGSQCLSHGHRVVPTVAGIGGNGLHDDLCDLVVGVQRSGQGRLGGIGFAGKLTVIEHLIEDHAGGVGIDRLIQCGKGVILIRGSIRTAVFAGKAGVLETVQLDKAQITDAVFPVIGYENVLRL